MDITSFLIGNASSGGKAKIKPYVLRPDAEIVQTYTYDKLLVHDLSIEIPAYSTSSKSLIAAEQITPTVDADYASYDYQVVERALVYPIYAVGTTVQAGLAEYWAGEAIFDLIEIPGNTIQSASGVKVPSRIALFEEGCDSGVSVYDSSANESDAYSDTPYGTYASFSKPILTANGNSGVIKAKSPVISIRGSSTYFPRAVWESVSDIRAQYIIDVYRAPKNNLNLDGWGAKQALLHAIACGNSQSRNLS